MDQFVRPWFWPTFLPPIVLYMHMILYLKDTPGGCGTPCWLLLEDMHTVLRLLMHERITRHSSKHNCRVHCTARQPCQ